MSTTKKNSPAKITKTVTASKDENKPSSKIILFLKNNKAATILSIALIVIISWFSIKLSSNESKFIDEKTQLISQHKIAIDSLKSRHLEVTTTVFSWSVRSELLRNNSESINQLISLFVKASGADLVQLINPEDNSISHSSDKKYEGNNYPDFNFTSTTMTILNEGNDVKIITPIMGYNNLLGILYVEIRKEK
jgi:hypothetical protein